MTRRERNSVRAEISEVGGLRPETLESRERQFRHFERWCEVNRLQALPCDEQTVLRFLHSNHPNYRHSSARTWRSAIDWKHVEAGYEKPCSLRVASYLARLKKDQMRPAPMRKVDALRVSDASDIYQTEVELATEIDPGVEGKRAIATVAALGGHTLCRAARIPASSFTYDATSFTLPGSVEGTSVRIDANAGAVDAYLVEMLTRVVLRARTVGREAPLDPRAHVAELVRLKAKRLALDAANPSDLPRLLAHLDPNHFRRVRDLAYLLVGLTFAARHITLAHIDIEDVKVHDNGFTIAQRRVKNAGVGEVVMKPLGHVDHSSLEAEVPCPACALQRLLDYWSDIGRTQGPVFATLWGGQWRRMTPQNARHIVKGFWARAGKDTTFKISTRALRAGAATSASEAGYDIHEIAEHVTDHKTWSICRLYVRNYDPWSHTFHLEL